MCFFYKSPLKSLIFEKKSPKKGSLRKIGVFLRVPFFHFSAFFSAKFNTFLTLFPHFSTLANFWPKNRFFYEKNRSNGAFFSF